MENGLVVSPDGTKRWYKGRKFHREGGPAIEGTDGSKYWFKDDQYHREDGPAVEYPNGTTVWYFKDKFLGCDAEGFWTLWDRLTVEQRGNPTLLRYMPR